MQRGFIIMVLFLSLTGSVAHATDLNEVQRLAIIALSLLAESNTGGSTPSLPAFYPVFKQTPEQKPQQRSAKKINWWNRSGGR